MYQPLFVSILNVSCCFKSIYFTTFSKGIQGKKVTQLFWAIPAIPPFFTTVSILMNFYLSKLQILGLFVMVKYTYLLKLWKVLRSLHFSNLETKKSFSNAKKKKKWYLKSYHVPKWLTCAWAEAENGCGFELKTFKEIWLTGVKFYCNSSSGSGVKCTV